MTVYVCAPGVEVTSAPGELEPLASVQLEIPAPYTSKHEKLVLTDWPTAYSPPDAGDEIDADGGAGENTDTVLSPWLATANSPSGLNASETGDEPTANGEPLTCVKPLSYATENTDTVLSPDALASASRPPLGLNATENGPSPVVNGEPLT